MANAPQMKIPIGADTQDFEKGARKVKQEMRSLDKVSSDAFSAIGNALGVDTGRLQEFSGAIQGLGHKFTAMGTDGAKAFGSLLTSIGPVAAGIAGLGIAGATLAFKALNSEAQAFKNTIQGANIELATTAYVETYKQSLRDMRLGLGEGAANFESSWKKAFARVISGAGTFAYNLGEGARNGATGLAGIMLAAEVTKSQMAVAEENAEQAAEYQDEIYKKERERSDNMVRIAELSAEIAQQQLIAREALSSGDYAAGLAAIEKAEAAIAEKKALQVPVEKRLAELMAEKAALASSSVADVDAANRQAVAAFNAEKASADESRALNRIKTSLANAAARIAASTEKERKELEKIKTLREEQAGAISEVKPEDIPDINPPTIELPTELKPVDTEKVSAFKSLLEADFGSFKVNVGMNLDAEEWNAKLTDAVNAIKDALVNTVATLSESIGTLIGNLITGKNTWADFANSAVSSFGDLAIAIGKIAIEAGASVLAIDAALASGGPQAAYAAIAAGTALVILGAAVKAGLSNIASGNYSAGVSTVASTTAGGSLYSDYAQRDVYVNVTGTLEADGDKLLAVINNTEKNRHYTT